MSIRLGVVVVIGWSQIGAAPSAAATACEALSTLAIPAGTVTGVGVVARGTFVPANLAPAVPVPPIYARVPDFCRAMLTLKPSADSDIRVEVWLPASGWNGKFQAVGNGGFAGVLPYAAMARAVLDGYATAGTDTGHVGNNAEFAVGHPEKLVDFGDRAIHEMAVAAKRVIDAHYGRAPQFSYFNGCSQGGRQGITSAQRYPADFDGIVAGAAAWDQIRSHAARLALNLTMNRSPEAVIPPSKYPMIHEHVLKACDGKDGVVDGVLEDPTSCSVDFSALACKGADSDSCLTAPQLKTVEAFYGGTKNSKGELIFSGQALGNPLPALRGVQPGGVPGGGFDTVRIWGFQDANYDWNKFDLDRDMPVINSKVGFVDAVDPDLSKFKARGGKLLLYAGWGDTGITPENTVLYSESVLNKMGRNQDDFVRLFMVPGMGHCRGGDGPHTFDTVGTLEAWREKNVTPTQMMGFNPQSNLSRPICAFPQVAQYKGSGNRKDASNWSGAAPQTSTR